MPVAVIDVGSNTVRLVVMRGEAEILSRREMLRLGSVVERYGRIPAGKLAETTEVVSGFADAARAAGAGTVEILITSPGRQAQNGAELAAALGRAGRCSASVLSAAEEGQLAFAGALHAASPPGRRQVAVVDVGGGSAQIVVGTRRGGPTWTCSIDIGSQRLTSRVLSDDPAGLAATAAARAETERYLLDVRPPPVELAFAVGGSARAVKRLAGAVLTADELENVVALASITPAATLVDRYGLDPQRVRTVTAGAVILSALQDRLGVPLRVVRGGVREGALLELAARRAAA